MSLKFTNEDGTGMFMLELPDGGCMTFNVYDYIGTDIDEVLKDIEKIMDEDNGCFVVYNPNSICGCVSGCDTVVADNACTTCVTGNTCYIFGGKLEGSSTCVPTFTVKYRENRDAVHQFYDFVKSLKQLVHDSI